VDTSSAMDHELKLHWGSTEYVPRSEKSQAPDTRAMWTQILNSHGEFFKDITHCKARVIFLCHAAVNNEAVAVKKTEQQEAKLGVSTLAGTDIDIKPQISGQALDLYLKNASLILPMKMFGQAGTSSSERKFFPHGGGGMEGGNRYQSYLKQEEEAHLGKLLKKIESAAAKIK
jgi:hypothetical protein